jgi:hypothetical protein
VAGGERGRLDHVVADNDRAGRVLFTLAVDDLDARLSELAGRGLAVERVAGRAVVSDPDDNRIALSETS